MCDLEKVFVKEVIKKCSKNGESRHIKIPGKTVEKIFPFAGLFALLWIIFRVGSKPSRAGYPCVQAAAPVASTFIIYIIGIFVSSYALAKAKVNYRKARYFIAVIFALTGIFTGIHLLSIDDRPAIANTLQFDVSNVPLGTGKGIFPGRVIWAYDPDATNEDCTNQWGDGYFLPKNTNLAVVDEMLSRSVLALTGQSSVKTAWDSLFFYFNNRHQRGNRGYLAGEKIFIKTNGVGTESINANYELTSKQDYQMSRTSPQPVLVILRQLVNDLGVSQENISVGDPMNYVIKEYYNIWSAEFPDVKYIDPRGTMGRTKAVFGLESAIFYSDRGEILRTGDWSDASAGDPVYDDHFYTVIEEADYLINIAALKAHARAGVSLCTKSHFGSHTRIDAKHLHMGLVSPDNDNPTRAGYGKYRIQVDLMGHRLLGGNTLLFIVDGLWGSSEAVDPPCKFNTAPFNHDWSSSFFISQDPVAIESVCLDFLKNEFTEDNPLGSWPQYEGVDDYLQQAADTSFWPEKFIYDPEKDGTPLETLGVYEHWNNSNDKQYSRNLGADKGIELIKLEGTGTPVVQDKNIGKPVSQLSLFQNYPNPFNPSTTIMYSLPSRGQTVLTIYDIQGREIRRLAAGTQIPGIYKIVWDGHNNSYLPVPGGVYFAVLRLNEFQRVVKLILVR